MKSDAGLALFLEARQQTERAESASTNAKKQAVAKGIFTKEYEPVIRRMTEAALGDLLDAVLRLPLKRRLENVHLAFRDYRFQNR